MLEDPSITQLQCSGSERKLAHLPFSVEKSSCTLERKAAPKCLTIEIVFFASYSAFLFLQSQRVKLRPERLYLVLKASELFKCLLLNFRQACTCVFLIRGTLWVLDFNILNNSVLLIVFWGTVA